MFGFRNTKGAIVADGNHVADTVQCVHCAAHWTVVPGSGKRRGYCTACNGFVCGREICMTCVPFEAKMEVLEGTRKSGQKYFAETLGIITKYGNCL